MIVRTWMAYAKPENARAYREHVSTTVLPRLQQVPGFLGLQLCQAQPRGDRVELFVITRWESLDAVKAFAGPKPDKAVIDAAAKAVLEDFDDVAFLYDVVLEGSGRTQ
jgi:heme-degrading monooxygenase HmoA